MFFPPHQDIIYTLRVCTEVAGQFVTMLLSGGGALSDGRSSKTFRGFFDDTVCSRSAKQATLQQFPNLCSVDSVAGVAKVLLFVRTFKFVTYQFLGGVDPLLFPLGRLEVR